MNSMLHANSECMTCLTENILFLQLEIREDIKKKNCIKSENGTIGGGRGSEKLLNFHHLQMMNKMDLL